MDESSLSGIYTILALIALDIFTSLAYASLINSKTDYAGEDSVETQRNLHLTSKMADILVRFMIAIVAVKTLIEPMQLSWGASMPGWVAYAVAFVPLVLIVVILGDLLPSTLGATYADRIAPIVGYPFRALALVLFPLTWLTYQISFILSTLMGGSETINTITEEELLKLVDAGQSFEDDERKMIHSVLELDETTVTEMMIPRIDIIALDKTTSIAEARQVFLESGHSRLPVYAENIDHITGLCYVKDLLEVWHNGDTVVKSIEEITRPVSFVPESMTADQLLREFQKSKVHLVIVVEEYGGTAGLVTLENLLEEIVGDIQDEYDKYEEEEIVQITENEYRIEAGTLLHDVNEMLDVTLENEDVDTLGGFIFNMLDRVPEAGETIHTDELEIHVEAVEGRRIREVRVVRKVLSEDEETPVVRKNIVVVEEEISEA